MGNRALLSSLLFILLGLSAGQGQEKSVKPGINDPFQNPDLAKFLGIFEGESREIFAQRAEIVAACKLKPGMAVADIGAGTGLFTRPFAQAVGPKGKVYAVDIAQKFLDHIDKTCKEQGISNVKGVLCTQTSVQLPPNSINVAFVCDTYHHFEFPFRTLASIHQALRPGGRLVLIDFHRIPGKSSDWVMGHVRAGQEVVRREVEWSGFKVLEEPNLLKENYCLVFEKLELGEQLGEPVPATRFTYKKTRQGELELHLHYPAEWKPGDRRPAIVFFFGGGWTSGNVRQFEPQAKHLAERGMVAARADYRVKSRHDVTPAECVEDAKSAVRWLRQNAVVLGVDPERIVAAGGSAGGHIAACTAFTEGLEAEGEDRSVSSRPNALVLFNPVVRFAGQPELMTRINNDDKLGRLLSPTLHLGKAAQSAPPALLLYGKEDRLLAQGEEFAEKAKQAGARAELFLADGVGHGFFNRPPWLERTLQRADEFLVSLDYLPKK